MILNIILIREVTVMAISRFSNHKIETKLIHGGIYGDELTGAVNVPIYQTSTYEQEIPGVHKGFEYSRTGNPTRKALEALIVDLENGTQGFAFASGLAAITTVLSLFKQGDKLIISDNVYGGTYRLLSKVFDNFGISFVSVDTTDPAKVEAAITSDVKAIYIETPTNPLLGITDLQASSDIAHKHGLIHIVDKTVYRPYIQRPIEHGADIVIHSATKYLGGHSDLVAGLVVVNDAVLGEKIAFIQNAAGGVLGPFDSFLLIRGIKTLGVRLDRHVDNAVKIADALKNNADVKNVYYPGFEDHPGHDINLKQAKNGGAMKSFELTEGHDINKFFRALSIFALAESLGGVESLVCHPATMTHAAIPKEVRDSVGITDGLIRVSVGIEDGDELTRDLLQAIDASRV